MNKFGAGVMFAFFHFGFMSITRLSKMTAKTEYEIKCLNFYFKAGLLVLILSLIIICPAVETDNIFFIWLLDFILLINIARMEFENLYRKAIEEFNIYQDGEKKNKKIELMKLQKKIFLNIFENDDLIKF